MKKDLRINLLSGFLVMPLLCFAGSFSAHADDHSNSGITMFNRDAPTIIGEEEHEHSEAYSSELNDSLADEQNSINQQLDEIKANTIPNYESRVDLNAPGYFGNTDIAPTQPNETTNMPDEENQKSYVYKKKPLVGTPPRSFNNVR